MAEQTAAYIHLWGQRVGAIVWNAERQIGEFEFERAFLAQGLDVAPVMMPLLRAGRDPVFRFDQLRGSTPFRGLPGLLADSLPDRYGHRLIDAWLARTGRAADSMTPVETLCFIGRRGMGALEYEPVVPRDAGSATRLEVGSLVALAEDILTGRRDFSANLKAGDEKALHDILKIGTSAGGARAKAVIAYEPVTGDVRSGQAEAPRGYSHWLIKLDGVSDSQFGASAGYGRVEMAYYRMATACGIDMTDCRLYEEHDRAHFMTRRFDRVPGAGKLHVQTFCAMMHYDFSDVVSYSYEQLFQAMRMLRLPHPQLEQLYRRMVFNVLARNCDDHTKNFAFLMDQQGQWQLSPAYDVCHAYRPGSAWVSRQALSVNGKRENIGRDDFVAVAKSNSIKKPAQIIDEVQASIKLWKGFAEEQKVNPALRDAIGQTLLV